MPNHMLAVPAVHGSIGIWPVAVEHGRVVFEATPSARFFNPMALVHGGWTAMLLDTAMGCAVHSVLASGQSYATVDLHTSFVRPVRDRPRGLRCEARLLHLGSWIATAEGRVYDATELLLAHGTETCQIFVMRPGSA